MSVVLEGVASNLSNEERALAYLKVEHNGQTYDWQLFIPQGVSLSTYIASKEAAIYADIDAKEAAWAALTPKTREIPDPFGGEPTVVDIEKSEIVRPDNPDYYAKRRAEYPAIGEQLDALWKGGDAAAAMTAKIAEVKAKYPKT
jgi:hypothetical protein